MAKTRQRRQEQLRDATQRMLPLSSFSYRVAYDVQDPGDVLQPGIVDGPTVSVALFRGALPVLQATVLALREDGHSFSEIAALLGRSASTVRNTHRAALAAAESAASALVAARDADGEQFPAALLGRYPELSPLEAVVGFFLGKGLRNVEVAALLGLDPRTTWTVQRRIAKKGFAPEVLR